MEYYKMMHVKIEVWHKRLGYITLELVSLYMEQLIFPEVWGNYCVLEV